MSEAKINNLVFSSSSSVFESPIKKFIDEKTKTNPINPYGLSKLIFEKKIRRGENQGLAYLIDPKEKY